MSYAPTSFVALSIEGIGQEGGISEGYQSNGILWATSGIEPHVDLLEVATDWDWRSALQVDSLGGTDTLIEPFRGEARWSQYGFQLDAASNELAERLLYEQRRADGAVTSEVSPTDTSIQTDIEDGSIADTIIYVGNETIAVGLHNGGGEYVVDERGVYGSTAQTHIGGANLFTSTPFWDGRRAILHTVTHSGGPDLTDSGAAAAELEFEERWRGRIDGSIVQKEGKIAVTCLEMGAGLASVQGGMESRRIENPNGSYRLLESSKEIAVQSSQNLNANYTPKVVKADASRSGSAAVGVTKNSCAVAIDGEVYPAEPKLNSSEDAYTGGFVVPILKPKFRRQIERDKLDDSNADQPIADEDCYEVFAASRLDPMGGRICPVMEVQHELNPFINPLMKQNLWAWHPLTYWAAIMLSTQEPESAPAEFDVLQPDFSLNLRWLFADSIVGDIKELIRETPWMAIDRAVLGMGGKPVDLWRRANEMFLSAWGFYLGIDNNGKLTIHRIRTVDIDDFEAATQNQISPVVPEGLEYKTGRGSTTDVFDVNLGATGPAEGDRLLIKARDDASDRAGELKASRKTSLNLETVAPERYRFAIDELTARAVLQHFAIPRVRFRVEDHLADGNDYGLGKTAQIDTLNLEPEWIVDKLGDRVGDLSTDGRFFTGFLIGRKFMAGGNQSARSYELEMLMHGDTLTRYRAPSGVVQGSSLVSGDTQTRIDLGGDGGSTKSAFGDVKKDASRFTTGDEVVIRDADGSDWTSSEILEVDTVETSGTDNFIVVDGTYASLPPTGKVVEIAFYDSDESGTGYRNDGLDGSFTAVARAYVYMCDQSDTIGDEPLDADEYGA